MYLNLIRLVYVSLALLILSSISGCTDDESPSTVVQETVYMVGNEKTSTRPKMAVLWVNGRISELEQNPSYENEVFALAADSGDIYVVGIVKYASQFNQIVYWKNNVYDTISCPYAIALSPDIDVVGGDIYISSSAFDQALGRYLPFFFLNGTMISLPFSNQGMGAKTTSIEAEGLNVYVGGCDNSEPVYWHNGVKIVLPKGQFDSGYVQDIKYKNGIVYALGALVSDDSSVACVWQNGALSILSNSKNVKTSKLYIYGVDTYVAGHSEAAHKDILWIDGNPKSIAENYCDFSRQSVYVFNNNIYFSSKSYNQFPIWHPTCTEPVYWKNNTLVHVGRSNYSVDAYPVDIYVK